MHDFDIKKWSTAEDKHNFLNTIILKLLFWEYVAEA